MIEKFGHDDDAYEIRIRGHLDARWATTLGVSELTHETDGTTVLRSDAMDQPALHGLLQRIRDLSLPLISVARVDPDRPTR
jgi:hypothetical protein